MEGRGADVRYPADGRYRLAAFCSAQDRYDLLRGVSFPFPLGIWVLFWCPVSYWRWLSSRASGHGTPYKFFSAAGKKIWTEIEYLLKQEECLPSARH